MEITARTLVAGVLKELKEIETQRMDKSAERRHGDIERMPDEDDQDERDPADKA